MNIFVPEIPNEIYQKLRVLGDRRGCEIIVTENATEKRLVEIYSKSLFGIYFYDVKHNNILKQNFPLKTLEYTSHKVFPVINKINAHIYLEIRGFKLILPNYNSQMLVEMIPHDLLEKVASDNLCLLRNNRFLFVG